MDYLLSLTCFFTLFSLKYNFKVPAPIRNYERKYFCNLDFTVNLLFFLTRKVLRRFHARLQNLLSLYFQSELLMIIVWVKLSNLVVEKILFIFERLRSTNVLNEKVCESCCYQVAVPRRQLNLWLGAVVYHENGSACGSFLQRRDDMR